MPHLLLVCTANISRSPMAEGVARQYLAPYPDWSVSSAAASAPGGSSASDKALQVLAERGIDLSAHRSRTLTPEMMAQADLVLVMAQSHKTYISEQFLHAHKVHLFSEMAGSSNDIADPKGQPIEEYRRVLGEIDDLLKRGLDRIVGAVEKQDNSPVSLALDVRQASRLEKPPRDPGSTIKEQLRKQVNFGCPVRDADGTGCGSPVLVYHHFDPPWKDHYLHNAEGMIALCPEHHYLADGGHYSIAQLREFKRSPYIDEVLKVPWRYPSEALVAKVGRNLVVGSGSPIRLEGRPVLHFRPHKIPNLEVSTTSFDSDIRDISGECWLEIDDGWFSLRLEDTTDVVFRPQQRQFTAKHNDSTYLSLRYRKYSTCEFVNWAESFIRSKNFGARDALKTVENAGALDSDGNVPVMTVEGQFKTKNIAVRIRGHDLHTALSLRPGHKDELTWQHSRIVNSEYRQTIRRTKDGPEIFSVG